jgi:hypothetical protein
MIRVKSRIEHKIEEMEYVQLVVFSINYHVRDNIRKCELIEHNSMVVAFIIYIYITIIGLMVLSIFTGQIMISANASHGSSAIACEADGYEAGRDGPFSQELYDICKKRDS